MKSKLNNSTLSFNAEYKGKSKRAIFYACRQLMKQRKKINPNNDIKSLLDKYINEYESKHNRRIIENA